MYLIIPSTSQIKLQHVTQNSCIGKSCHNSLTQYFKRKCLFKIFACVPLKPLVYLVGRIVACGGRKGGNRHTHRPSTVTLAHARQGLIKPLSGPPSQKQLSHGSTRLEAWSMKTHACSKCKYEVHKRGCVTYYYTGHDR